MKKLLLSLLATFSLGTAVAQLPNGSIAPDFTATDLNGNTYHLYDLLDDGVTVFLDVSATWCGPCWNYHNTHKLRDLYDQYGPNGTIQAGRVMVFFAEGDANTTLQDLQGTGGNTQGNWVAGTTYPILHTTGPQIGNDYNISYFPTLYAICPNRIVNMFNQNETVAQLFARANACPVATQPTDGSVLGYTGMDGACTGGNVMLSARIQNMGLTPLTSCTLEAVKNGVVEATYNWTGNLATYGYADVNIGAVAVPAAATYTIRCVVPNDANAANNSKNVTITPTNVVSAGTHVRFDVMTDNYPGETSYTLKNSQGVTVQQGGFNAANTLTQLAWTLDANECYELTVLDSYGDGMCCGYGQGYYRLVDTDNNNAYLYNFTGAAAGNFTEKDDYFKASGAVDVHIINVPAETVKLFPNPVSDNFTLEYTLNQSTNVTIELVNGIGQQIRLIESGDKAYGSYQINVDASGLANGTYSVIIRTGNETTAKRFSVVK